MRDLHKLKFIIYCLALIPIVLWLALDLITYTTAMLIVTALFTITIFIEAYELYINKKLVYCNTYVGIGILLVAGLGLYNVLF